MPPLHLHPSYQALLKGIRRELLFRAIWVAAWIPIGYYLSTIISAVAVTWMLYFSIGIAAVIFCYLVSFLFFRTPPLLHTLLHQPENIVWVYGVTTAFLPYGIKVRDNGLLYFKLIDGQEYSVSLPARKLKTVSLFLNRMLPNATFGYSKEKAARYEADPTALKRTGI